MFEIGVRPAMYSPRRDALSSHGLVTTTVLNADKTGVGFH